MDNFRDPVLTSTYTNGFDSHGTIQLAEPLKGSARAPKGIARVVLLVSIGLLLCIMPSAGSSAIDANKIYITYKQYALYSLDFNYVQYRCLSILYGKESAWNPKASNGSHYGIPQGRSTYLARVDGYKQIQWGLAYITHRYNADTCQALTHWRKYGWH